MRFSHKDYDEAIKSALRKAESARNDALSERYDTKRTKGEYTHEDYDRAIRAAIKSQRKYTHEDYDKAIERALRVNRNKNKSKNNSENILTNVEKSDSLEEKVNVDDDDEPKKWITTKGTHVPLDENGNAIGGPLEGRNFSGAKSEKSSGESEDKQKEAEKAETSDTPKDNNGEHKAKFGGVPSEEFCPALAKAKDDLKKKQEADGVPITSWRVSYLTPEEIAEDHPGAVMHTTECGSTVAVDDNHDIFAVCRNPNEGEDGLHGKDLIKMAIEQGGDRLDSFSGNHGFYTKLGFEPVTWCPFNPMAVPRDWKEKYGKESVIFYKYTGKCERQDKDALDQWLANTPPIVDYTEAKTARDEIMKKYKGEE